MTDFLNHFNQHHILGIGSDICDIRRIEKVYNRFENSFLKKTYSLSEIAYFDRLPNIKKIPFLAKRFAAKEAIVKALGTGFGASASMTDISVLSCPETGKPLLEITGQAHITAKRIAQHNPFDFFISLSDEHHIAQAFCVFALVRTQNQG